MPSEPAGKSAVRTCHLGGYLVDGPGRDSRSEPSVQPHALVGVAYVLLGEERRRGYVDPHVSVRRQGFATDLRDGLAQHLRVQVEADERHVARLLGPEQGPRSPDLQIAHRHLDAAAQVGELADRGEPVDRLLRERRGVAEQEQGVRAHMAAPDPALQLVELGQAEALGVLDDERVGVRVVDPRLDDRGGDENVDLTGREALHHALQLVLGHLAVRDADPRLGHHLGHPSRGRIHRHHPVEHIVDLASALQLAPDGRLDEVVVELADVDLHREAVRRRRVDDRHVAHARERHLHGARYRRRAQREHVDLFAKVLDVLLVLDAETLLLVHDHEPEVLGRHVA
jgi:hypothetical protein